MFNTIEENVMKCHLETETVNLHSFLFVCRILESLYKNYGVWGHSQSQSSGSPFQAVQRHVLVVSKIKMLKKPVTIAIQGCQQARSVTLIQLILDIRTITNIAQQQVA